MQPSSDGLFFDRIVKSFGGTKALEEALFQGLVSRLLEKDIRTRCQSADLTIDPLFDWSHRNDGVLAAIIAPLSAVCGPVAHRICPLAFQ